MQFIIIARDGQDPEALNRRMAVREAHINSFKDGLLSGQNILGGAILNSSGTMCGSVMIVDFPDRTALDQWLKSDPYVTGDVWKEIEILPFRLAGKS